MKRWSTFLLASLLCATPSFGTAPLFPHDIIQAFLTMKEAIPLYTRGSVPQCYCDLSADGTVRTMRIAGHPCDSVISIEAVFDVIAAVLTGPPISSGNSKQTITTQAADLQSHFERDSDRSGFQHPNQLAFSFLSDGPTKSGDKRAMGFPWLQPEFRSGKSSTIRALNTEARQKFLSKNVVLANHSEEFIPMDEFLSKLPESDNKVFVLNAIPLSVLSRYSEVMKPEDVCSTDNFRTIDKSFFHLLTCDLASARTSPEWTDFFEKINSTYWSTDVLNSYFLAERARRNADLISQNATFRSLCRAWQSFFLKHPSATKEQLIAERDSIDREFSDMLKK